MQQYQQIKAKYNDAILLFRIGDFYIACKEDAVAVEKVFDSLYKTTKSTDGQTTGLSIPHVALGTVLHKLVKAGYKVGICDQLEDPKIADGLPKRGVTNYL